MARYRGPDAPANRTASDLQMYLDAQQFVMSTMNGLGFGNIVPSTNLEWFADIVISIAGSSVFAGLFGELAVVFFNKNKSNAVNEQMFQQAKQFATQRQLSEGLKKRIKVYYQNLRLNFMDI